MPEEKKTKYVVSGGNLKFKGKWFNPQDTIELTASEKKNISGTHTHIKLTKAG